MLLFFHRSSPPLLSASDSIRVFNSKPEVTTKRMCKSLYNSKQIQFSYVTVTLMHNIWSLKHELMKMCTFRKGIVSWQFFFFIFVMCRDIVTADSLSGNGKTSSKYSKPNMLHAQFCTVIRSHHLEYLHVWGLKVTKKGRVTPRQIDPFNPHFHLQHLIQ